MQIKGAWVLFPCSDRIALLAMLSRDRLGAASGPERCGGRRPDRSSAARRGRARSSGVENQLASAGAGVLGGRAAGAAGGLAARFVSRTELRVYARGDRATLPGPAALLGGTRPLLALDALR